MRSRTRHTRRMARHQERGKAAIGARLRAARETFGLSQAQFADRAKISRSRFNQYETGTRALTLAAAHALCDEYGLTLDWLLRGNRAGLPYALATAIAEHEDESK